MNTIPLLMALTFLTANVNGLHDTSKWAEAWCVLLHRDIICLQEMHLTVSQEKAFTLYAQSYDFFFSHSTLASAGICVAVKCATGDYVVKVGEIPGRLLALDLRRDSDGLSLHFIGIYAPNDANDHSVFFHDCTSYFSSDVVLGGDFNSVIDPQDRLSGNLDSTSMQLQQCLNSFTEPPGSYLTSFTYHHPLDPSHKSHLDRFYVNFDHPWIGYSLPSPLSDHYMVGLHVPKDMDSGPHQWHFPDDLLSDESF